MPNNKFYSNILGYMNLNKQNMQDNSLLQLKISLSCASRATHKTHNKDILKTAAIYKGNIRTVYTTRLEYTHSY